MSKAEGEVRGTHHLSFAQARARSIQDVSDAKRNLRRVIDDRYKDELTIAARFASNVAQAFVAARGLSLDDLVDTMRAPKRWPARQQVQVGHLPVSGRVAHSEFVKIVMSPRSTLKLALTSPLLRGKAAIFVDDGRLEVLVVSEQATLMTVGGELRLALQRPLPAAIISACSGRQLSQIFDDDFIASIDRTIITVEEDTKFGPQTFVCREEYAPYRVPWLE